MNNMRYSDFLEREYNKKFAGKTATQKKANSNIGVIAQTSKKYSDKPSTQKATFYYGIKKEAQILFGNACRTNVVINYNDDIDYDNLHKNIMPAQIVAIACGFDSFEEVIRKKSEISDFDLKRMDIMIEALIPVTEEEYNSIQP